MGLNMGSKNQNEDLFENMKILATTVETLNKQIEGKSGGGLGPEFEGKFDSILGNIGTMNNKLYQQLMASDRKLTTFMNTYETDKKRMNIYFEKNNAVFELLKGTVGLLEEIVDILKEKERRDGGNYVVEEKEVNYSQGQNGSQEDDFGPSVSTRSSSNSNQQNGGYVGQQEYQTQQNDVTEERTSNRQRSVGFDNNQGQ